ncbi:MAG: nitrogen regulation protein NR(I) [gamma proteobacterium symbiont of Lucinoma myriamae]|nr:nitrogen regulation protein NR(I) [gamma proteobacterium symbiont of Lucinoma myriamae]MCU7819601.1 nitrogen regulation protein NR(I) [gamma proteobacterium symbiont of Lucinoma myriamae]MCU7831966.1 nitrogen regulation protein NR(I) [gamma proteobacterium symbiont of Lucinoma myriamae]
MSTQNIVWVIDDDRSIRWVLEKAFKQAELQVESFENAESVLNALKKTQPDTIVTDIRMPGMDGFGLLEKLQEDYKQIPVIIMTAHSDLDSAVSAYEGGAFEYLPKPFDVDEAVELVQRALSLRKSEKAKQNGQEQLNSTPEIIGEAASMQEVFRAIGRLSRSNITVMINGASGTGKELVAQALHRHSPRSDNPFIALNTAAIPKDLLESELFGHERGAFTGAQAQRVGRFEQADGGTLFLDEIGDMPAELQTRLLRVLSDGEFYRVGGRSPIKVDVRIIAATHQNLEQRVQEGLFREDLFHRLNVIRIHMPTLRERQEDIALLSSYFLNRAAQELNVEKKTLDTESEEFLSKQAWPGNVRQLENVCRWLTVMSPAQIIHIEDMPPELQEIDHEEVINNNWEGALRRWLETQLSAGEENVLDTLMPDMERIMIEVALKHTGGRKQDAARLLGWGRNTLTRKIKELEI